MIRLLQSLLDTASEFSMWPGSTYLGDSPSGDNSVAQNYDFAGLPLPLTPPDGSNLGISDTRTITSDIAVIRDVNVWIRLENPVAGGAFNGDFYATLTHNSGFAVLLNRPGRRAGGDPDPFGYPDNGFTVTLDDQAPSGDIHNYRLQLPLTEGGPPALSHATEVDATYQAALTGQWAPDGRNALPSLVTSDTPRTRLLDQFNGLPASGTWTLFVADLGAGGTATLKGWGLQVTGYTVIPESADLMTVGAGLLVAWAIRHHRAGHRRKNSSASRTTGSNR